jgi:predicted adenylyl cyclase CyaB
MVEIEAKMKLDDPAAIARRLREAGASPAGEVLEQNTFYDRPDRSLLARDEGVRLRVSQDLRTGRSVALLTHKGPNRAGKLKAREETELTVSSAEDAGRLLEKLGFVRWLSFQKRRASWKLDNCKIEMDHLPHIGDFIEIEGPDEQVIMRVREKLGLAELPLIKASYAAMLASYLQEQGLPADDVRLAETVPPLPPPAE